MDDYTKPEWSHSALITIDVQRDFTLADGTAFIPGTAEIVPEIRRLVCVYRAAGLPVIHVVRLYLRDGSNVDLCRRAKVESGWNAVEPGSEGSLVVEELLPSPCVSLDAPRLLKGEPQLIGIHEWIVYKPRWGAFYETRLGEHLHQLGVNTIVFAGCNFPNCPRTSMYEASERDFRVVLVKDAVSGIYDRGVEELRGIGVSVVTTDECVDSVVSLSEPPV